MCSVSVLVREGIYTRTQNVKMLSVSSPICVFRPSICHLSSFSLFTQLSACRLLYSACCSIASSERFTAANELISCFHGHRKELAVCQKLQKQTRSIRPLKRAPFTCQHQGNKPTCANILSINFLQS